MSRPLVQTESSERCPICRRVGELTENISRREDYCPVCGANRRNIDTAKAIITTFGDKLTTLGELISQCPDLKIYEAQASGPINEQLKQLKNYTCSEYLPGVEPGEENSDGLRCENLESLSFPNGFFDLVITQDVFEHINNPETAFAEIYRVLKPGGWHIFTIPLHQGNLTQKRVLVDDQGYKKNIAPPIYHGDPLRDEGALVISDFGDDIVKSLKRLGFVTSVVPHVEFYSQSAVTNMQRAEDYQRYQECISRQGNLLEVFKYNSIVFKSQKLLGWRKWMVKIASYL